MWPFILFLTYPVQRGFVRNTRSTRTARLILVALGFAHLVGFTWIVSSMDGWYELPEWRGFYHATLVPSLRVFVSLLWAWFAHVLLVTGFPWKSADPRVGVLWSARALLMSRTTVAAALLTIGLASWPFWGWTDVSMNVLARTQEFNKRHEFELRFLQWLFDADRDGYAALLHGPDPDDWDPAVIAETFHMPDVLAPGPDRFEVIQTVRAGPMPNVVLLYLEGIAPAAISAYGQRQAVDSSGRPIPATPHIDAIAGDGVTFTNARSHYPTTWPGWVAINSGRGSYLGELRYTAFLEQASQNANLYEVLRLGGIDRWCHPDMAPFFDLFVPERLRASAWKSAGQGYTSWVSAEEEAGGIWRGDKRTRRMIEFIETLSGDDRFFLSEHMNDTHEPWRRTPLDRARELGFDEGLEPYESDAIWIDGRPFDAHGRYLQVITRTDGSVLGRNPAPSGSWA